MVLAFSKSADEFADFENANTIQDYSQRTFAKQDFVREGVIKGLLHRLIKALPLREGGERYVQLYLVYADRDGAGPGVLRLADIVRETVRSECVSRGESSG